MLNVQTPVDMPNPLALKPNLKIKKLINSDDAKLPPKDILPPPPGSLEEAKKRVHDNMKAIQADADAIRRRAVEIGRDLNVMKTMVPHGGFLDYVKSEFGLLPRTAQRYMRVADFIEQNPDFMEEAPELSALYELTEGNFAPEVLESIKEAMKKGSVPKTKAGVKKAVAAKTSSNVVKSKKPDPAKVAAAAAVTILIKHIPHEEQQEFMKLFRKAGAAFLPALKDAVNGPH